MYCTINDLLSRIDEKVLINLSNDSLPSAEINLQRVNENITIADDLINSALRNRYHLPLKYTPKIITQISADIVIYRLYSRRPQDIPKNYVKNFEDAMTILKELQTGEKILEISSSNSTPKMYKCDKTEEDRKFDGRFLL